MSEMTTTTRPPVRPAWRRLGEPGTRAFLRHYLEMVVVMVLGMVLLALPLDAALELVGVRTGGDQLMVVTMGVTMTVPMWAWMRFRGHGWRTTAEMCATMVVPTLLALLVLVAGLSGDIGLVMAVEHTVMFAAMFGVMLLRRDEYAGHHHGT